MPVRVTLAPQVEQSRKEEAEKQFRDIAEAYEVGREAGEGILLCWHTDWDAGLAGLLWREDAGFASVHM